jgi:hypothetical protein
VFAEHISQENDVFKNSLGCGFASLQHSLTSRKIKALHRATVSAFAQPRATSPSFEYNATAVPPNGDHKDRDIMTF